MGSSSSDCFDGENTKVRGKYQGTETYKLEKNHLLISEDIFFQSNLKHSVHILRMVCHPYLQRIITSYEGIFFPFG